MKENTIDGEIRSCKAYASVRRMGVVATCYDLYVHRRIVKALNLSEFNFDDMFVTLTVFRDHEHLDGFYVEQMRSSALFTYENHKGVYFTFIVGVYKSDNDIPMMIRHLINGVPLGYTIEVTYNSHGIVTSVNLDLNKLGVQFMDRAAFENMMWEHIAEEEA